MRLPRLLLPFLFACSAIGAQETPAPQPKGRIVVLHTNDLHGQVYPYREKGGLAALSALVKKVRTEEEAKGSRVVVVDCGDFFQGTPEGDLTKGRLIVEIMNEIGYDALCLGNHDFDQGQETLRDLAKLARFPFLSANTTEAATGKLPDYAKDSVEIAGVRFVGVITPDMPIVTSPRAHEGLKFEDPRETLKSHLGAVVLSHCGSGLEREFHAPFVCGGHSHERISEARYQQAGSRALFVGYVALGEKPEAKLLDVGKEQDPRVLEILAKYSPDIDRVMNEVVGELAEDLPRHPRGLESSPLGNLLCDLMREKGKARIALHNRTGIRDDLKKGPVRVRDVYQVSPFHNTIVTMDLTGKQIVELLEFSVSEGSRFLLEVSGLEFEYDPAAPEGKRVTAAAVKVGGDPLSESAIYRVATNSFLAGGGDGHSPFRQGANRTDTFLDLMEVHRDYLKEHRPLRYEFQNRIRARK